MKTDKILIPDFVEFVTFFEIKKACTELKLKEHLEILKTHAKNNPIGSQIIFLPTVIGNKRHVQGHMYLRFKSCESVFPVPEITPLRGIDSLLAKAYCKRMNAGCEVALAFFLRGPTSPKKNIEETLSDFYDSVNKKVEACVSDYHAAINLIESAGLNYE